MPFDRGHCQIPYPSPGPKGWGFQLTGALVIAGSHCGEGKMSSCKTQCLASSCMFYIVTSQNKKAKH